MRSWFAIDDDIARLMDIEMGELGVGHARARPSDEPSRHHASEQPAPEERAQDRAAEGGSIGGSLTAAPDDLPASPQQHSALSVGSGGSGGNTAGSGGHGTFIGAMLDIDIAIYAPVNIAIAVGDGATATATQSNFALFDQGAFQMAGIGGAGGSGNLALGGDADLYAALFHMGGGATGGNGAGNGGDGIFAGLMIDNDTAVFAPINVAVAGPGATVDAHQINGALFHQGATQMAGIGGAGGHGNLAQGGDLAVLAPDFADHLFLHA